MMAREMADVLSGRCSQWQIFSVKRSLWIPPKLSAADVANMPPATIANADFIILRHGIDKM